MRIVTVNVPESYIDAMKKLVGDNGFYPSRSELIRVAVRKFIIRELESAKQLVKYGVIEDEDNELEDEDFVRVPISKKNENNEEVREFETFKIVERLR
ncbi:MAG: ribbon-helix-helix domain-containing protein [Promethearchaeia archaeon]